MVGLYMLEDEGDSFLGALRALEDHSWRVRSPNLSLDYQYLILFHSRKFCSVKDSKDMNLLIG